MNFPVGEDAGWASAGVSACGSGIGVGLYRHLFSCPKEFLKVGLPWSEEARVSEAQWIDRYLTGLLSERGRSEEHTSELQSRLHLVCRLLLEKKKGNRESPPTS